MKNLLGNFDFKNNAHKTERENEFNFLFFYFFTLTFKIESFY